MKSQKEEYYGAFLESQMRRNSLVSQTKRESLSGSISSRRNSHCSIIQTSDHLVLVECRSDPLTKITNLNQTHINDISDYFPLVFDDDKESSAPIPSHSSSTTLDLDKNIKHMEETQERINKTLANLWKLKYNDESNEFSSELDMNSIETDDARTGRKKREKQGISMISPKLLSGNTKEKSYVSNRHYLDTSTSKSNDFELPGNQRTKNSKPLQDTYSIDSEIGNCDIPDFGHLPVKSKIQGLFSSVINVKNRRSRQKCIENKHNKCYEHKDLQTKESLSVEDFRELVNNLPANKFSDYEDENDPALSTYHFGENNENHLISAKDNLNIINKNNVQFHIVRELVTSERDYVDSLKLLCRDFRYFITQATEKWILPDQDLVLNFTNLPEICKLSKDLLKEFEFRLKSWDYSPKIADILVKKGPNLTVYMAYMKNFSEMIRLFDECCCKYQQFANLVTKFEKLPKCRNLKIKHFLLKPVQRLPQYKLLLGDYLKHMEEGSEDFGDTMEALRIVSDVLKHTNDVI